MLGLTYADVGWWEELIDGTPDSLNLIGVIVNIPALQEKAWAKLKANPPSSDFDLSGIVCKIPELRDEAWQMMKNCQLHNGKELFTVVAGSSVSPEIRQDAWQMMQAEKLLTDWFVWCALHLDTPQGREARTIWEKNWGAVPANWREHADLEYSV